MTARAESPLILPRRLAIALLAEAQKAGGARVEGVIGAHGGAPVAVWPGAQGGARAGVEQQAVWARYHSGHAPDDTPGRQLLISVDTKGVLQLRCWEVAQGPAPRERAIAIVD